MDNSSGNSSPMSRFSGSDFDIHGSGFDPTYTAEISNRMRVPKKIQITGQGQEGERSDNEEMNGNWSAYGVRSSDKVQMQVPDRIMVTGQERHVGAKAMPRELQLETVVMPPDAEIIRIQTPPRSITLLSAPNKVESDSYTSEDETLIVENNQARFEQERAPNGGINRMAYSVGEDLELAISLPRRARREVTIQNYAAEGDEELEHLREQFARMNRRLLALEEEAAERKEKERYLVMAGLLYVAYKTVSWLFKSGPPQR